ncbi:MAG: 4Fe-4S binding protein [Candidatus Methanospirareceae archaeon]
MSEELSKALKEYLLKEGASKVGFTIPEKLDGALEGSRPEDWLKEPKSIVSIVVFIKGAKGVSKTEATLLWRGHVMRADELALKTAKFLMDRGYRAIVIPPATPTAYARLQGEVSHKHIAQKAGLGCIGKTSLFLTKEFGPRLVLTSVITDAPLVPDEEFEEDLCSICGDSCKIMDICPVKNTIKGEKEKGYYKIEKKNCIKCYKCFTECVLGD